MSNVVIEKGRYRVTALPGMAARNGEPRGYYVEVKRGRDWKQLTFKSQRADALKLFGEKAKVRI